MRKRRILVLAQNLPYPVFGGCDLRNWQNVKCMSSLAEVAVLGICHGDPRLKESPALRELAFYRCTGDPRLAYPLSGERVQKDSWLFRPFGHPSDSYFTEAAAGELRDLARRFRPDIVLVEGLWLQRYIDVLKEFGCRIILDCHNVEASVAEELGNGAYGNDLKARMEATILPERVRKIEAAALARADVIWACSSRDAGLIRRRYHPAAPVHVVSNGVSIGAVSDIENRAARLRVNKPHSIIFPGMYAYPPTRNAAAFLIEELFPRVAAVFPDAELVLAGNRPADFMLEAAQRDCRIKVTGPVRRMRPYLNAASVMAAPIFHGGGTRFKLLESFAAGAPVISTAKGAEGLDVEDGVHLLIAEDISEFVNCLTLLWRSPTLAAKLAENAWRLVRAKYSWDVIQDQIRAALAGMSETCWSPDPVDRQARAQTTSG